MKQESRIGGRYAKYALAVLLVVNMFNATDRQILSILAEAVKADLSITDAQIGFLYGTAFAVFYAIFGIPLARLADTWVRSRLISIGLCFWSTMTALSGTARRFGLLATYRVGVGVGEASATPAALSMLSDYFPPGLRTTVISIYYSGVYIGLGVGVFLGGLILDTWQSMYTDPAVAPLQLKGWQVTFFAVGLPGILLAVLVWTLREPVRGLSEGIATQPTAHPFREAGLELASVLPPFHLIRLWQLNAGTRGIAVNLVIGLLIGLAAWGLIAVTGTPVQWGSLAVGVYAVTSWVQSLRLRDPATFAMIFKRKSMIFALIGFGSIAFVGYGLTFWAPPFFQRVHGVSATEAGMIVGLSITVGGWAGVTLGGILADLQPAYTTGQTLCLRRIHPGISTDCTRYAAD